MECPSCKLRTLLPDDKVESLAKNLVILKTVLHKEDDEQVCNFCVRKIYPPKPATFYCGDCAVYSCGTCSDEIHSQMEFRTHSICLASLTRSNDSVESSSSTGSIRSSSATSSKRSSSASSVTCNRPRSSLLDYSSIPGKFEVTGTCTQSCLAYYMQTDTKYLVHRCGIHTGCNSYYFNIRHKKDCLITYQNLRVHSRTKLKK